MRPVIREVPCRNSSSCVLCGRSTELWSWIERQAPLQSVPPGNLLFNEGERPNRVIIICAGVVQLFHSASQGRVATLKLARAGELLGFSEMLAQKPYDASAITTEWCQLRTMTESDFSHLLNTSPELRGQMLALVAKELCETRERLCEFLLHVPAKARLARFLLTSCESREKESTPGKPQRVRTTLNDLAQLLGLTDRGLRKALTQLERAGLVKHERGAFVILDLEGLKQLIDS